MAMPPRIQAGQALGMTQCASPLDTDSLADGTSKEALHIMNAGHESARATRQRMKSLSQQFFIEIVLIAAMIIVCWLVF